MTDLCTTCDCTVRPLQLAITCNACDRLQHCTGNTRISQEYYKDAVRMGTALHIICSYCEEQNWPVCHGKDCRLRLHTANTHPVVLSTKLIWPAFEGHVGPLADSGALWGRPLVHELRYDVENLSVYNKEIGFKPSCVTSGLDIWLLKGISTSEFLKSCGSLWDKNSTECLSVYQLSLQQFTWSCIACIYNYYV